MKFCVGLERTFDDVFVHLLFYCCFFAKFSIQPKLFINVIRFSKHQWSSTGFFRAYFLGTKRSQSMLGTATKPVSFCLSEVVLMVTQSKFLSSQNLEGTFTVNVVMEMFNHQNSLYLMLIKPIKFHSLNSSVSAVVQKDLQWNLIVIF